MKIGILTFHMSLNYGAFWQAYALNKFIDENLNVDCYLINYESKYTFNSDITKRVLRLNVLRGIYSLLTVAAFKKGWDKMKKTRFYFEIDRNLQKEFDAIVLGSDEVWNYKNTFVHKDDYNYFGAAFEGNKIISFSPSFGTVNYTESHPKEIVNYIKRIDPSNISVRDENSQKIIEKYTGKKVPVLVDPVFLYNADEDTGTIFENYILIYGNKFSKDFIVEIKNIAKSENLKIYSFGFVNTFADKNILFKSPIEIVKYFKSANCIITNMYHGVVFSLHYKKQFWMEYNTEKHNKVETLLQKLDLSDRVIKDSKKLVRSYELHIDNNDLFVEKLRALEPLIEESKEFLRNRIESLKSHMKQEQY